MFQNTNKEVLLSLIHIFMPLNSQKFLVNALWKKGSRSQEAELFIRLLKAAYLEK